MILLLPNMYVMQVVQLICPDKALQEESQEKKQPDQQKSKINSVLQNRSVVRLSSATTLSFSYKGNPADSGIHTKL